MFVIYLYVRNICILLFFNIKLYKKIKISNIFFQRFSRELEGLLGMRGFYQRGRGGLGAWPGGGEGKRGGAATPSWLHHCRFDIENFKYKKGKEICKCYIFRITFWYELKISNTNLYHFFVINWIIFNTILVYFFWNIIIYYSK